MKHLFSNVFMVEAGSSFIVSYLIPRETGGLVAVEVIGGRKKLTAKVNIIVALDGIFASMKGAKHCRFMRAARMDAGAPQFLEEKFWPKMRLALQKGCKPRLHSPGGFNPVGYADELAIPDFVTSGSWGWIIRKSEIGRCLSALPSLPRETGEINEAAGIATFWIAWNGAPPYCFFGIFASESEASGMTWEDESYQYPPTVKPTVQKWKLGVSRAGNPVILNEDGYHEDDGRVTACAPYYKGGGDSAGHSHALPIHVPIEMGKGGKLEGKSWNNARRALLKYYEEYK